VIDFAATDNAVAIETRSGIQLSVGDESWRTVHTFPNLCNNRFALEFIREEMLAFRQCDNGIAVVDTSGKRLFNTTPFAPDTEFYRIATSRNARAARPSTRAAFGVTANTPWVKLHSPLKAHRLRCISDESMALSKSFVFRLGNPSRPLNAVVES
jgi:hypothetical protein